jgi:hypothetical protein
MLQILEGSIVCGKSGAPLKVVAIDGERVVVKSGDELLRVARSAILNVISIPEPTGIEIGDRLRRNAQPQIKYPKAWFVNEVDDRPPIVPPIESATVERFSIEGYWVRTPDDRLFHVPESAIEEGTWELIKSCTNKIDQKFDQQN